MVVCLLFVGRQQTVSATRLGPTALAAGALSTREIEIARREIRIMRLSRFLCLLALLGGSAVAAFADPMDPGAIADPSVILDGPSCPAGAFCVDLMYSGPTTIFTVSNPL